MIHKQSIISSHLLNKQQEEQENTVSQLIKFIEQIINKRQSTFQRLRDMCGELCVELEDKTVDLSLVIKSRQTIKEQEESWNDIQSSIRQRIDALILAQAIEVSPEEERPKPQAYQNPYYNIFRNSRTSSQSHSNGSSRPYPVYNGIKEEEVDQRAQQYSMAFEDYINGLVVPENNEDDAFKYAPVSPKEAHQRQVALKLSLYEGPQKKVKAPSMYRLSAKKLKATQTQRSQTNQEYLDVNIFVNKVLFPAIEYRQDSFIPKKIILNNYFAWKFSSGRRIWIADSGNIQMELTNKIKALFKKAGHNRKLFKGIAFKKQYQERMNLTDKVRPSWLNDDSPFDGVSHLDPLENRFFKQQIDREKETMSQYSSTKSTQQMYNNLNDDDDVRYSKYEAL